MINPLDISGKSLTRMSHRILNHGSYAVCVVTLVNWVFAYKEARLTQEMWIPGLSLQPASAVLSLEKVIERIIRDKMVLNSLLHELM